MKNTVCTYIVQAINRIPTIGFRTRQSGGRCGHEVVLTESRYATGEETLDKLLKDDLPVVIDFWTTGAALAVTAPIFGMSQKSAAVNRARQK